MPETLPPDFRWRTPVLAFKSKVLTTEPLASPFTFRNQCLGRKMNADSQAADMRLAIRAYRTIAAF
jgi:hypothetical protein